jgi:hypothetical protein
MVGLLLVVNASFMSGVRGDLHGFLRVVNAMSELLQFLLKVKENL